MNKYLAYLKCNPDNLPYGQKFAYKFIKGESLKYIEDYILNTLKYDYKNYYVYAIIYCIDKSNNQETIKYVYKDTITDFIVNKNKEHNMKVKTQNTKHYKTFGEMWQGDTLYSIRLYYDVNNGIVINDICKEEYTNITFEQDNIMLSNERFMRIWLPNMNDTIWIGHNNRRDTFTTTLNDKCNFLKISGIGENTARTFYFLDKNVIPEIVKHYAKMVQNAIKEYQKECEKMFIFADKVIDKLCEWDDEVNYKTNDCITLLDKTCVTLDNAYNNPEYEIIKSTVECPQ